MATAPQNGEEAEGVVRIGMREIYDHVRDLVRSVDLVGRQIEMLTTSTNTIVQGSSALEARVRALETQKVVTPASMWVAIGVLASVAGVLITLITVALQR
jgi:hypothetical protein